MFLVRRPPQQAIDDFIRRSRELPLSYAQIGIASESPAHYDIDQTIVTIGRGEADFFRAKAALADWKHFELPWVELVPRHASIEPGSVVGVLVRHLGFWSLNGCRVVYGTGDRERGSTFGFAYGTLTNHGETGEEIFEVAMNPESLDVTYRIRAVSRPRAPFARIGYPFVRALQRRFRRDSAEAMRLEARRVAS